MNQSLVPTPKIDPFAPHCTSNSHSTSNTASLNNGPSITVIPNPLSPETVQLIQQVAELNQSLEVAQKQRMSKFIPFIFIAALTITALILTVLFIKSRSASGVPFNRPPLL
jgi:hypothetical protein